MSGTTIARMITLAIEQSTSRGSVALLRDETVLAGRAWEHTWFQNQQLFALLPGLLDESGLTMDAIDTIAVGIGPGSFAGCRVAVSAARAFAIPDGKRVIGLSSGEALAWDLLQETNAETVVVIGDARRQHAWYGCFGRGEQWPVMTKEWSLQPVDQLAAVLPAGAVIAGPDWDRISSVLKHACPESSKLVEENRVPTAATLGLLSGRRVREGAPAGPVSPIYLHPAVSPR